MNSPLSILFVCTANICRSAYADVRARTLLRPDGHETVISSAGTWGWDAQPMDATMAAEAAARGAEPEAFRSRRLDASMVAEADVILTAAREHRAFILEDWPVALRKTFTLGQFAEAVPMVDPGLRGRHLIAAVQAARPPARPAADIADPYRRGVQAASACAQHIDDLLAATLPRLAG